MENSENLLEIKDLTIEFATRQQVVHAVNHIDLSIGKGKRLGLVGETGAGKTTTALGILKLIQQPQGRYTSGEILFKGENILTMPESQIRGIRGKEISMIFQDPMTALNPIMTVGDQIAEVIALHDHCSASAASEKAKEMLEMVGIRSERSIEFPHQFSGGMKQRVVIAMALACNPSLLIADEPTTALDVTIQAQVLEMMSDLRDKYGTSLLLITHDLGIVAENCDDVVIMYAGEIIEQGTVERIFHNPKHPYTLGLFGSLPSLDKDEDRLHPIDGLMPDPANLPTGCKFHERCAFACEECIKNEQVLTDLEPDHKVRCWRVLRGEELDPTKVRKEEEQVAVVAEKPAEPHELLRVEHLNKFFSTHRGMLHAVEDVSFVINKGETLGVVGESGCGKSTLGRTVLKLLDSTAGKIYYDGKDITEISASENKQLRKRMQIIFQDPYSSLNPRKTVSQLIAAPLETFRMYGKAERQEKVLELMDMVGLSQRFAYSYPHELDGGRRQRIGIARALALDPEFIVCDEPVSALDVSIQAQILNLLQDLQRSRGLTYIFVTHDLSVVRHISTDILVMYIGAMVEKSPAKELFQLPLHPYTKGLLSAIPVPNIDHVKEKVKLQGELTSPVEPKNECRFVARCPYATEQCRSSMPAFTEVLPNHFVACHHVKQINNL